MEDKKLEIQINLIKICMNNTVTQMELEYFNNHITNYIDFFGDFYRYAVQACNSKVADIINKMGYAQNSDSQMDAFIDYLFRYQEIETVYKFFNKGYNLKSDYEDKIIKELDVFGDLLDDRELFEEFVFRIIRRRKIIKILNRINS